MSLQIRKLHQEILKIFTWSGFDAEEGLNM